MEVSIGAAAFWLALAAIIIAGGWFKSRSEAMKHETLRRLAERTGEVDEAQLRLLLTPPAPPPMVCPPQPAAPGAGFRACRIIGVLVVSLGLAGMLVFSLIRIIVGIPDPLIGVAISSGAIVLGAGFFAASRFAEPPPDPRVATTELGNAPAVGPPVASRAATPAESADRPAP